MAGGQLSSRQKMINLMYLVFIAMLAMTMSKEVLTAFGFFNEDFEETSISVAQKNVLAYEGLAIKAQDQPEKFTPLKAKADQIKILSDDFYNYLGNLKTQLLKDYEDKKDYEAMDKTDFLDEYFFIGDDISKEGKEYVDKIINYRTKVTDILGDDFSSLNTVINKRFSTNEFTNSDGKKVSWLSYKYKGYPAIASLTSFTQLQASVRNTESDVLTTLLGGQLEDEVSLNNYQGIVSLGKTAYFSGERVKGQVVLGRYDNTMVPKKVVLNGKDVTSSVENGQVIIDMPAGNVGTKAIKGAITFMQDGEETEIPFESEYSVIAEPNEAVISADKMNVVYRGLDNPISISVPGVGDRDIRASVGGGSKLTKVGAGKYILSPGGGNTVSINVSAKLSSGKTITTPKTFRIKDIPTAAGTVRGQFGVIRLPRSSLGNIPVGAALPDFVFDLQLAVRGFTVKVPGQLAVKVNGSRLDARAKSVISKAKRGDVITIFDIIAVETKKGTRIKRVIPASIEVIN